MHTESASTGLPNRGAKASINRLLAPTAATASTIYRKGVPQIAFNPTLVCITFNSQESQIEITSLKKDIVECNGEGEGHKNFPNTKFN